MLKLIFTGIWICVVTMGSSYAAVYWMTGHSFISREEAALEGLDYEKTRPINVPIIEDGLLQGYVVAQFVFTVDAEALRKLPVPPHPFVVDEAFRLLYADEKLDFRHLARYDLDTLKSKIRSAVNARMQGDFIREILVEELNYFSKEDVISH